MKDSVQLPQNEEIAVIGYAARLPGANNVSEVWDTLVAGRCNVGRIPDSRWSATRFFEPDRDIPGRAYARSAGL